MNSSITQKMKKKIKIAKDIYHITHIKHIITRKKFETIMKQKNLFKKTIYFISFISTFIYILYRILFTLPINMNFFSLFLGIIVLFTELWESFNFFIYYFNILKNTKKNSPLPPLNAKQRSRWARGCVQMSKKYKIFTCKGLSLKQKLEYFSCVSYWYLGIRRLVYLIAPLLFSLCGITVINCNIKTFICLWLPCYLLKRFAIDILEQNQRSSTWNTIYETILTPFHNLSLWFDHRHIKIKKR